MAFLPVFGSQDTATVTLTRTGLIPISTAVAGAYRVVPANTYRGVVPITLGLAGSFLFQPGLVVGAINETWTVANAAGTLNGDNAWDDYLGFHLWGVVSTTAQLQGAGGGTRQGGRVIASLDTDDYEVSITLAEWLDSGSGILVVSPLARMQGDTSATFYALDLLSFDGTPQYILYRFVADVATPLGTVAAVGPLAPTAGTVLTLRVHGSGIQGLVNGTLIINVVDPTPILTGRYVGLQGAAAVGNRVRVDSLTAGPLANTYRGAIPITGGLAAPYSQVLGGTGPTPVLRADRGGRMQIKQNTAFNRMVRMRSSADHQSPVTGATLTITLSKDNGAFAAITPTVTERGNGFYVLALTTAMNDTLGAHTMYVTASGADPEELFDQVVAEVSEEVVEGAVTLRQSLRLANAANGAKVDGMATNTVHLRDLADSKNRVTATVDANGNRTVVTRDLT